MLHLSSAIANVPILSLRTGSPVATAIAPIINPNYLKIEGFYCEDIFDKKELVLLWQDIRDTLEDGFVVDDIESLVEPEELVRLKDVLELRYELIGKPIETVNQEKVGKVSDYALETTTMYVQKLYASQSLLKSIAGGTLSIDRSQIVDVTSKRIVIQDLLKTAPAGAAVAA